MFERLKYEADQNIVHVWSAELDVDDAQVASLAALLDAEESARARRFYFERDRRRFTVARGILRTLLGRYLEVAPGPGLAFAYGERGKPSVVVPVLGRYDRVCFNVSHSDGRALLAFARGAEVGIDLEAGARLGDDWPMLARRIFSAREQTELAAVPTERRRAAFLNGWTRKEAYLKAAGLGIVDGLASIEVTLDPALPPALLSVPDAHDWSLYDLRTDERFAAALVAAGGAATVERQEFCFPVRSA